MYINNKEYDALFAAKDFVAENSRCADDDKFPHDIIDGLDSIIQKFKRDREIRYTKQQVNKQVKIILNKK
jgi:hypothetical protein